MVRYNLIEPEHANGKAGHQAAVAYQERTGHLAVPYGHRARLEEIVPGVTADGVGVGRWLQRQRQHIVWHGLKTEQSERLGALGVAPLPPQEHGRRPSLHGDRPAAEQ
ncbi:helicase associated domain-containing protein [Streptomyces collinus]|uniref:helicase associated domain-containing protein n=1 Tax=Streptomyces collinus TaxID=42684 RepID=UPI003F54F559